MLSEVREKVYRVEWERWVSVATYAVLTLALLFMADDGSSGPGSASTLARVIGYVMVAGAVVLVVRSIRIGIVMSSDRVVVRGILCTRHFATRDVIAGWSPGSR